MPASFLDHAQLEAVRSIDNSVVSAGAGSGKTTVLAERYLRIVEEGLAEVEEILTLTYTRKAAAEMYERIYARLLAEADKPRIREQIARFDRAQISTLDSFCVQVLRNSPQHFGIRSDFRLGEDETTRMDEETALRFLLDHSDDEALLAFIELNGFESVWKDFFVSLGANFLHLASTRDFHRIYENQVGALEKIVDEGIDEMEGLCGEIGEIDPGAAKAIADAHAAIGALPELRPFVREKRFEELASTVEQLKLGRRTGNAKSSEVEEYKETVGRLDDARKRLAKAAVTLASRATMRRVFELCGEYQELLLGKRRSSGALSFQDVVEMAVRLLTENRALRRYYKRRYRFVMIDEFQDNNELQKRLLYLLAEVDEAEEPGQPGPDRLAPDKLFFVGDEKQSIYRFRGADVAVFRGLSNELGGTDGRQISLATNYRSAPELIDFFNGFFARIFADPSEDFEARFEGLRSGLRGDGASEPVDDASIRLFYKPYEEESGDDEAHSDDAEAYYIARFIKESVEKGSLTVRSQGKSRPAEWGDFALLMRTTSNQIRYEKIFRRLNIPYSTQSIRTLFLEAPLNDIYSVLQLAIYPDDRSAYAALLRSPLVNLSDYSLIELLLEGGEPFSSFPSSVAERGEEERWSAGRELLQHLRAKADIMPIARLIDDIWYRFGYRYTLLKDASYHPYLEYYDYFRKLAHDADSDGRSLSEFLDLIRPNLGKYEKLPELEVVRDQVGGVQLLTIHKSKGLEFPVVILANSGNLGRSRGEGSKPYYLSDEFGPTLRVTDRGNYFYDIAREDNQRKERAELKRLLYVAMTRAESHLIVSGCHNRQNRNAEDVLLNMLLRTVSPEALQDAVEGQPVSGDFAGVRIETIPSVTEEELRGRAGGARRSDPRRAAAGYEDAETVDWSAAERTRSASELSGYLWQHLLEPSPRDGLFPSGFDSPEVLPAVASDGILEDRQQEALFGSLVHALIELRLRGVESPTERDLSPRILRNIERDLLPQLLSDARTLAEVFIASELGGRALAAPERHMERSFLYRTDSGFFIRGSFDLLFVDEEGGCVVDFKTDRELQPAAHAVQLHAYRLAAAELLERQVRSYLYYLRGGRLVEVNEDLLSPLYRRFFETKRGRIAKEWEGDGGSLLSGLVGEAASEIGPDFEAEDEELVFDEGSE